MKNGLRNLKRQSLLDKALRDVYINMNMKNWKSVNTCTTNPS